jgi:hypothetical protein
MTIKFKIPEYAIINERLIQFSDMRTIQDIQSYMDVIERLHAYDANVIQTSRRR